MALVKTIIDGKEIEVEHDRWALDVAEELGTSIPTLCHHAALTPYGACRLCVVEVTKGKWTWLTTSCDLPIRPGLSIRTDTEAVIRARKMTLELLWSQAPDAVEIQRLAEELGVDRPRFTPRRKQGKCILCGLCVRVCRDLIGTAAIGFSNRGEIRRVGTPFETTSNDCIGCMACVAVCPTGHIKTHDQDNLRRMTTWKTDLEMAPCEKCGRPFAPAKQLDYIKARLKENKNKKEILPIPPDCPECRRAETARRLASARLKETAATGK